jgi:hypothetical protein
VPKSHKPRSGDSNLGVIHLLSPLRGYRFLSSVFLGLTPKATRYRHYVAGKSQLQKSLVD